jgi:hypothetical protein
MFPQKLGCFFSLFHMPLSHFMVTQTEFHICYTTFSPRQNGQKNIEKVLLPMTSKMVHNVGQLGSIFKKKLF